MRYQFHLCTETRNRATAYLDRLRQSVASPGAYLDRQLQGRDLAAMTLADFLDALVNTRPPLIFAESAVRGDGQDWNLEELGILGDIGVSADVTVFDDGRHYAPAIHPVPFPATLLFVPGALLRNGWGQSPADEGDVVRDGDIHQPSLTALYTRRLLPLLEYASACAQAAGQAALVTIPGLGCGQFAGRFQGRMGEHLRLALMQVLETHAARLSAIRLVHYDPYNECSNTSCQYGHLELRVRPLLQNQPQRPQLCAPRQYEEAGDDFSDCRLFSFVAWDPVSWPGNDYYGGSRSTDDGVKAAATDVMRALTGMEGRYDPHACGYQPPAGYDTWGDVVARLGLRLRWNG